MAQQAYTSPVKATRPLKRRESSLRGSLFRKTASDASEHNDDSPSYGFETISSIRNRAKSLGMMLSDREWHDRILRTTADLIFYLNNSGNNKQISDTLQNCAESGVIQQVVMADKKQKMLWLEKIEYDSEPYKMLQHVASNLDVPILQVIRFHRNDTLEAILNHGVDVNLVDYELEGWSLTPLHAAVKYENIKAAKLLLQGNANVNQRNCLLQTPLSLALHKGTRDLALLFLKHPSNSKLKLNFEDTFGNTEIFQLLNRKLEKDDLEILEQLILRGADIHGAHCGTGLTPLLCILQNFNGTQSIKAMRLLLSRKVDPNVTTNMGRTALHLACALSSKKLKKMTQSKRCEVVQLLLQFQANPNAVDKDFNTPLHLACQYEYAKVVEFMLDYGALVGLTNASGRTALDLASPDSLVYPILVEHAGQTGSHPPTPRRNSCLSLFSSEVNLNDSSAWTNLRQEVSKYESTLRKFTTRFHDMQDTDEDVLDGRMDSMMDPEELTQAFGRVKFAIQRAHHEAMTNSHGPNQFSFSPRSVENGTIHNGRAHQIYSAFRSLSILIGPDWKSLFRHLMASEDPNHTEILISELQEKYHAQIREQTYQSLHCWYNSCPDRSNCFDLLKNALQEIELMNAFDQVCLIEKQKK